MAGKKPAPGAGARGSGGNDIGGADKADHSAEGEGVEDRAPDSEFTRQQFWFLRQVAVDRPTSRAADETPPHKLALPVAFVFADHANRKTGLMFPSQGTVARIIGVDARSVRACIKALVDRKHLTFAGWIRPPNSLANVKAYRWNVHDQRVEKRFDRIALGLVRPGEDFPGVAASAPLDTRREFSGSTQNSPVRTEPHPEKLGRAPGKFSSSTRKDISDKPSGNRQEPSETTTTVSLPRREQLEEREKAQLQMASEILSLPLDQERLEHWRTDLAKLAAKGLDFETHVVPVMRDEIRKRAAAGEAMDVGRLTWFRKPALKYRDALEFFVKPGPAAAPAPTAAEPPKAARSVRTAPAQMPVVRIPTFQERMASDAAYLVHAAAVGAGKPYCRRQWAKELAVMEREGLASEFVVGAFWRAAIARTLPRRLMSLCPLEADARALKTEATARGLAWWDDEQGRLEHAFVDRQSVNTDPPPPAASAEGIA
ncbi:MAG TPA: hypothetical protein VII56_08305 [Rhizomicrobium sp.]